MHIPRWLILSGVSAMALSGLLIGRTDDDPPINSQLAVEHPECTFFGPQRERFVSQALAKAGAASRSTHKLSSTTEQVTRMLANMPGGSRPRSFDQPAAGSIDFYINADFQKNNITPAPTTTDWEFIRRVTLDLTGRIPSPDRVLSFVADTTSDKRAALIEELLAKPEWVDKWTMFYGDLFQNSQTKPVIALNRFPQGRNAFYQWIHDSLANGKPYNQMATELIAAKGPNSYADGTLNWLLNGWVVNGPVQDAMDQMTANTFDTFLGMTHVNCLLCHNGRGHLDSLNLWAAGTTRYQAWQLSAFLSRTSASRTPVDPSNNNIYYWAVLDNLKGFTTDYAMNTTTGNRPARVAPQGCKSGQPCFYVAPTYILNGDTPRDGESYREALSRDITGDFQFARAAVNYVWAEFFGRGIVDPPDGFDPARLDPDNPPPAPWTIQPSNPALLTALSQHFIDSGYDLKALMREIGNSATYQLSSRYDGQWNAAWEPYFARKFVRRLWGEEIHDAVAQSSGAMPTYTIANFTDQGFAKPSYAMQFPDVVGVPDNGGTISQLLDSFLRGNRDDQPRKQDGSILQALNLMNHSYILNRTHAAGGTPNQLIAKYANTLGNEDLVRTLFLNILSRYPSPDELSTAAAALPASGSSRTSAIQDLLWSLYNKVDFVFNY